MRDDTRRTLLTGFTAFGRFGVNPSALLAQSSERPFELLEVSYAAVDGFLTRLASRSGSFERLLMLGVRGGGTTIEIERVARNHVGAEPDVRGETRGPGPIDAAGPELLPGTLIDSPLSGAVSPSDDAGCYLCNYAYYRALRRFPRKRVGFVHVPPEEVMPLAVQRERVARLIRRVEAPLAGTFA